MYSLLVHRYFKVDSKLVYERLRNDLPDFETFLRHVTEYLEQTDTDS